MQRIGKDRKLERLILGGILAAGIGLYAPVALAEVAGGSEPVVVTSVADLGKKMDYNQLIVWNGTIIGQDLTGPALPASNTSKQLSVTGGDYNNYSFTSGFSNGVAVSGYNLTLGSANFTSEYSIMTAGLAAGYAASGNTMTIDGATIRNTMMGLVSGGFSDTAAATGNTLTINSGDISDNGNPTYQTMVVAGFSGTGNASDNTLNINGGTVLAEISAAGASYQGGNATNNTVNMTGGTVAAVEGGLAQGGNASGNTVKISGGTVNNAIWGGRAQGGSANDNTVTISGEANLAAGVNIYGGLAMPLFMLASTTDTPSYNANNNTINIMKAISVNHIAGGDSEYTSTGNTLNIAAAGVTVGAEGVIRVQNYNFYLPATITSGATMLTVNSTAATDVAGATIGAAALTGVTLAKGDTVNLIANSKGVTGDFSTTEVTTDKTATGLTIDTSYKLTVSRKDANTIIATVGDEKKEDASERAKSLVETRAATTTYINAGVDILASQGFAQAANAVALNAAENGANGGAGTGDGFTPFAALNGSSLRAESGSYVDTKGFGLNVGFARELTNGQGKLLFGPVVEWGGGNYESHLDDGTKGEGGAHYWGVGLMGRQVNNNGFYYEGSLRLGRVNADYKGNVVAAGQTTYDSSSNYWGAHLGLGRAVAVGSHDTLDGYLKYFYSHQGGDTTTIHTVGLPDEVGSFDAVNSHRLRLGARLTHKVSATNSVYGGLAYQHEFGGDARATFNGNPTPSPSVKGGSGMLELGWQIKPGGNMTLDLGVTGWVGRQRGVSARVGANWSF